MNISDFGLKYIKGKKFTINEKNCFLFATMKGIVEIGANWRNDKLDYIITFGKHEIIFDIEENGENEIQEVIRNVNEEIYSMKNEEIFME